MRQKLYLYPYDLPLVKILGTVFAIIFCLIVLLAPDTGLSTGQRLGLAFLMGISPFIFVFVLLYSLAAADKKANVRIITLDNKNIEIIFRDKSLKQYSIDNIDSISVTYTGLINSLFGPTTAKFSKALISINAKNFSETAFSSFEFSVMVLKSVVELIKYATKHNIRIVFNSKETEEYFEKLCR